MELKQVERLNAQQPQTYLDLLPQIFGAPQRHPLPRARARLSSFCADIQARRVGVEHVAQNPLAHLGAIRISRVDEIHTQIHRFSHYRVRPVDICRLTPGSLPGYPHRPETEPGDLRQILDLELTCTL